MAFSELRREDGRAEALASELAKVRREADAAAAALSQKDDEALQQKQTVEGTVADLQQLPQQEQKKTAGLAQEVGAARQAMTANAEQQRFGLDEAQARATALASELAGTRREIETQAAQSKKAADEAVQQKQTAETTTAELRQSLQQDSHKTEALARDFASVPHTMDGRVLAGRPADSIDHVAQVMETVVTEPLKAAEERGSAESVKLVARARVLLSQGNIGAARIVLERAAESGNAQASFMRLRRRMIKRASFCLRGEPMERAATRSESALASTSANAAQTPAALARQKRNQTRRVAPVSALLFTYR